MEQSPSKELYPLISGSKTSLATREQLSSILAYLDYDQVVALSESGVLDPDSLAVVDDYNLYWKERVEHWFGVTLSDYKVNWKDVYHILRYRKRNDFKNLSVYSIINRADIPLEIWLDGYRKETSPEYVDVLNKILVWAAGNNHPHIVAQLLLDSRVDPSHEEEYIGEVKSALTGAIQSENLEIIDMLLNNERVNLHPGQRSILRIAGESGTVPVVKKLLEDPRISPEINEAWLGALKEENWIIISWLLDNTNVDPSINNNKAIIKASTVHYNIVKKLLKDPRVDPSAQHNSAIIAAASYSVPSGRPTIINLLLEDPRVDPTDTGPNVVRPQFGKRENRNNMALKIALYYKNSSAVKRLIKDDRVKKLLDKDHQMQQSVHHLLNDERNLKHKNK